MTKTKRLSRTAALAQIVEAVPQVPSPESLNIQVGVDDIKTVAATRLRSVLMDARETAKKTLEECVRAHEAAKAEIEKAAKAFAAELAIRDAGDLVARMNAWLDSPDKNGTRVGLDVDYVTHDVNQLKFTARIKQASSSTYSGYWFSREYEVRTPPHIVDLYVVVAAASQAVSDAQKRSTDINRHIVNIPNMIDVVRSNLTIAKLSGQLNRSEDVIGVLESTMKTDIAQMIGPEHASRLALPA